MATENWTKVCIPVPAAKGIEVALQNVGKFVSEHRLLSSAALLLWSYNPDVPFKAVYYLLYGAPRAVLRWILSYFGFTEDGVRRDTWASQYQSTEFGGYTPRDSLFAHYQSLGARGYFEEEDSPYGAFMGIVGWVAFFAAGYVLFGFAHAK
ncbi:hypothetical protein LshimejAT787_0100220 [Lyophyllum shimeji]|uniref:Uncharacterized protein n=1 Tax=Lyophyllum shimeji TaxID=47721 RepID=A0A9P3PCU5_LYOSH|nr:hypothetical protein LshimejAT787_0100220 [Lyophyllum shimeji]